LIGNDHLAPPNLFAPVLWSSPTPTTTRTTSTTCALWSSGWRVGNGPSC